LEAIALQSGGYGHNMTGFTIFCVLGGVFLFSIIEMMRRETICLACETVLAMRELEEKEREERGVLLLAGDEYCDEDCLDEGGEKSVERVARAEICSNPEKGEDLDGSDDEYFGQEEYRVLGRIQARIVPLLCPLISACT